MSNNLLADNQCVNNYGIWFPVTIPDAKAPSNQEMLSRKINFQMSLDRLSLNKKSNN